LKQEQQTSIYVNCILFVKQKSPLAVVLFLLLFPKLQILSHVFKNVRQKKKQKYNLEKKQEGRSKKQEARYKT